VTGLIATALVVFATFPASARAGSFTINLGAAHNGAVPTGSPPWLIADFESTTPGTVTLTMTNTMPSTEFTPVWLFNVVSSVNPANLSFANVSGPVPIAATGGSTTGDASIKAGTFTVAFDWTDANNSNRFKGGTTVVETITDMADGITAASFNALSTGSLGGFSSAAKIQGIQPGNSGTIVNIDPTPEPSSVILGLIGFLGAACIARRRMR
jgi:hypothetical protein